MRKVSGRNFRVRTGILLQLEHVGETAEIYVNGQLADTLIKRPYQTDITGLLQAGENKIEIVAANLLINRMIDPGYPEKELEKMIPQWPYATGGLDQCRKKGF